MRISLRGVLGRSDSDEEVDVKRPNHVDSADRGFKTAFRRLSELVVDLGEERPPLRISSWTWGFAGLILAVSTIEVLLPGWVAQPYQIPLAVGAFLLRRVKPFLAIFLLLGATIIGEVEAIVLGEDGFGPSAIFLALLVVGYSIVRGGSVTAAWTMLGASVIGVPALDAIDGGAGSLMVNFLDASLGGAILGGAALLHRRYDAGKKATELETAATERNRLANDIHDSVAHHMSAIVIRAEAARDGSTDPDTVDALDEVRQAASAGLADVRHLVNHLREYGAVDRPLPGLGDLYQLAAEWTTPSFKVSLDIDADAKILPVTVSAVVYAICRESVTNTYRHATNGTEVHIEVRHASNHLDVTIADNGAAPFASTPRGHGLVSMTERAAELGGQLTAGPNPAGGWLVAARLPTGLEP